MLLIAKFYLQRARRSLYFKTILGPEKLLHVYKDKDLSIVISECFIFHNLTREFINDVISIISLYYFIDVFLSI